VAHVSLTRAECRWLLRPGNALFLDSARDDLRKRASVQQYHLIRCSSNNNGPTYALQHPALLCYRHYYYESKTAKDKSLLCWRGSCPLRDKEELCHHSYMNDISVLLIEPGVFEKFVSDLKAQADQPLKFVKILECNMKHIEKMIKLRTKVFVGARSTPYRIRKSLSPMPGHSRAYAYHLAFETDFQSSCNDLGYVPTLYGNKKGYWCQ